MALSATLTQTSPAINGAPTNFVIRVTNDDAVTAVNVSSIQPMVTTVDGKPTTSGNTSGPYASVGFGQAQVNGSQFNVQIPASGTVSFAFSAVMNGPQVNGMPATPSPVYLVSATLLSSAGVIFSPVPLLIALSNPTWGRPPGAPPNAAVTVSSLNFASPANSALAL